MHRLIVNILIISAVFGALDAFAQEKTGISGSVEWDTFQVKADVSLDLMSAGIRLPAGRTQAEAFLSEAYLQLIQSGIMGLQADSSSTIGDLVERGELTLQDINRMALMANAVPPALSLDMKKLISAYSIKLASVSASLLRHNYPAPVIRTLTPVSAPSYSGIVIIASQKLPVYSMRSEVFAVPCLFPKIWDSEMNLVYEKRMLESHNTPMVRYSKQEEIFQNNPSGISPELMQVVGERPLRIFASGVFGIQPTDLIIDRSDALLIISSEENRRLLSQGKVAFIMNDSVLKYEFGKE